MNIPSEDRVSCTVEPDPAWVCESCGAVYGEWQPLCDRCHGFDSLDWRVPEHAVDVIAPPVHALPALAGEPVARDRAPVPVRAESGPPVVDGGEAEEPEDAAVAAKPAETPASDGDRPPPTVDAARRQV